MSMPASNIISNRKDEKQILLQQKIWFVFISYCCLILPKALLLPSRSYDIVDTDTYIDSNVINVIYFNVAAVFVALLLILSNYRFYKGISFKKPVIWTMIFMLYCLFTSIWSEMPLLTIYEAGMLIAVFVHVIWLATKLAPRMELSVIAFILISPHIVMHIVYLYPDVIAQLLDYGSPMMGAGFSVLFCLALTRALFLSKTVKNKSPLLVLFTGAMTVFFRSAGSFVSAATALMVMFIFTGKMILTVIIIVIIIFIFFFVEGDLAQTASIVLGGKPVENIKNFTGRIDVWPTYIEYGMEKPFTGRGAGIANRILYRVQGENERTQLNAHNAYISAFLAGGLPGLIIFVLATVDLIRASWKQFGIYRKINEPERRCVSIQIATASIAIAILNLSNNAVGASYLHPVWALWCLLILMALNNQPAKRSVSKSSINEKWKPD